MLGLGDTARKRSCPWFSRRGGAGDTDRMCDNLLLEGVCVPGRESRLPCESLLPFEDRSLEGLFIAEYGLCFDSFTFDGVRLPPFFCTSLSAASGFGERGAAYAVNGFLKTLFCFAGDGCGGCRGNGLAFRLMGAG